MTGIIKTTGKTTADIAKQIAKQVVREPFEIMKNAPAQVGGGETSGMTVMQQVMTGNGKVGEVPPSMQSQEEARARRRIEELQEELKAMRQQSLQKLESYRKNVTEELQGGHPQPQEKAPLIEPTPAHGRGMKGPGQKKGGTQEMGKKISG